MKKFEKPEVEFVEFDDSIFTQVIDSVTSAEN